MYKRKPFFIIMLFASALLSSCGGKKKSANALVGAENNGHLRMASIPNISQSKLSIDDKEFTISADSIGSFFYPSDSALVISIKGINGAWLDIVVPNFFKCPCRILPGYGSARTDADAGTKNRLWPTATLVNYPIRGISFNNLNDGYNKMEVADNWVEIASVKKLSEANAGNDFLIEGKIHSTVFKSGYEDPANSVNKDYSIKGEFKIQTRLN